MVTYLIELNLEHPRRLNSRVKVQLSSAQLLVVEFLGNLLISSLFAYNLKYLFFGESLFSDSQRFRSVNGRSKNSEN